MPKSATTTPSPATTKHKKKKGRPSLADLKKRQQQQQRVRSTRRNTQSPPPSSEEYSDDDDERQKKKVKLVVKLPQLSTNSVNSVDNVSDSNNNNDDNGDDDGVDNGSAQIKEEKAPKAMDSQQGSPLEAGPTTTPLPDKKLLVFILDRLQKKDTHAVFSEPVDLDELPDYHEIIEHPMDFGTVRSKLDKGLYSNLEELEADVILICSNAMQYNPSDTVFFRQARSIQELAKRDFENLRQEGDDGELQPKVIKRGRPPSKHLKKPPGRPPADVVGPDSTSGATVANAVANTVTNTVDNTNESTPYNLRRGPMMYKNYADSLLPSHRSQHSELLADWNEEFPARIKRADLKYGNKNFIIDETRRDTYKQFHPSSYAQNSLLTNFGGERKQLLAVGLHAEHGYSRSLARFAANMGPIVWKVASKKIHKALPPGVTFAPGIVAEPEPSHPPSLFFPSGNQSYTPKLASDFVLNKPEMPSTSGPNPTITDAEMRVPKIEDSGIKSKLLPHHGKNGLNGTLGSNLSKIGMLQAHGTVGETGNTGKPSWQQVSSSNHRQFTLPVPPDLNVGLQGPSGSPRSVGLRIGSPQKPDLALQL